MQNKQRTNREWEDLIKAQAVSGLSVSQFCKQNNCSSSVFYTRKAALKEEKQPFTKMQVNIPAKQSEVIRLSLPSGIRIECEGNHAIETALNMIRQLS